MFAHSEMVSSILSNTNSFTYSVKMVGIYGISILVDKSMLNPANKYLCIKYIYDLFDLMTYQTLVVI